jgi:hypothetical protein
MAYHGGTQWSTLGYLSKAGSNVLDSLIIVFHLRRDIVTWRVSGGSDFRSAE